MTAAETLKEQIRVAFAQVQYPGDEQLCGNDEGNHSMSFEGDEPMQVWHDFRGKRDWRSLDAEFIDRSPNGLGSALSFFSHEAFHFYLPAYLIADIDGRLVNVNPVFHITHGLDDETRRKQINPQRYGERVWFEYASERFGAFSREEAAAVVAYLTFKRDSDECQRDFIDEAIKNYWYERTA